MAALCAARLALNGATMKKRIKRYDSGGILTPELEAAGWRAGQNENIRDEDRQAALAQFRAQMNAANSPEVYSASQAPRQSAGWSDAQAAQFMGRPVNTQPSPQARMAQSPEVYNPPRLPATFESGYPAPRRVNQEPFEENYPGPRNVRFAPPQFEAQPSVAQNPSGYLRTGVNPYVQDAASNFLSREDRAYQTAPLSREMVNNPARERLMRAIGENSAETYRRNAVNEAQMPNIMAKQARDELEEYRAQKGPYYEGKKAPTNKQLAERFKYFLNSMGSSEEEPTSQSQGADPERVQKLIDNLKRQHKARNYKKGGAVKKTAAVKSKASNRGDGIAQRGKTKVKYC